MKKILLVEDDADDETLIRVALEKAGIDAELAVARDGQEALDVLRSAAEPPAVVLLDLQLPKLDGLTVLRRIRAEPRTRLQPVVILTSSDESLDRHAGYAGGANSYVRKPVDYDEFFETVRALGDYWLTLNTPPA